MGCRARDWAKFLRGEFEAIYGHSGAWSRLTRTDGGTSPAELQRRRRPQRRRLRVPRAFTLLGTAVVAAGAILGGMILTGHGSNPGYARRVSSGPSVQPRIVSAAFVLGTPVTPRVGRIGGTRLLHRGGTLTLSGRHTPESGSIRVRGRWGSGAWATFAVVDASRKTFSVRIRLTRRGVLRLRIEYPDGFAAVGTYQVK